MRSGKSLAQRWAENGVLAVVVIGIFVALLPELWAKLGPGKRIARKS